MTLKELQKVLKNRPAAYINISDEHNNTIRNNVYFKDLGNYNNDISVLLKELSTKHDKVVVTPRLRNGTSSRAYKQPFTVILKGENPTEHVVPTVTSTPTPAPMTNGFMGLNAPQILDAFSAQRENRMLREQLTSLQTKYNAIEADREQKRSELEDAKRKIDRLELKQEDRPSAVDKLLEGIAGNPAALTSILGLLGNRGATQQLNAAQPVATSLEGNKALLQQVVDTHPEEYCKLYIAIINRLNTDEEFAKEVNNLLKKETVKNE